MIGIYKWTSPSGKYYIGQSKNLEQRKKEFTTNPYNYCYNNESSAIDRARRKYPDFTKWSYTILQECKFEELDEIEKKYIKLYDSTNSRLGYNSQEGGQNNKGRTITKWGTLKQIEALKNRRCYKGENNPNFGKHLSEEARERIRKAHLGKPLSEEHRKKLGTKVNQYDLKGNYIKTFNSMVDAAKEVGVSNDSICRVCKGKNKTGGGFIWKYAETI